MEDRLEIAVSKTKNIGLISLGVLLTFIGFTQSLFGLLFFSKGLSYLFLGMGGIVLIGGVIALIGLKGPRLILTKEGLMYNPKTNGFVKWIEIEGYTDFDFNGHHTILIRLKDVDAFIEKQQDEKIKKNMKRIMKIRETPISIDPLILEISRSKLKETLHTYLVKYGNA